MTYKAAVTLDGRMTVPGERWISGEESRRLVHELRAASDAVAVGMGTVRADNPHLDARGVEVLRQPRRLAFGHGPLPEGSELELLTGTLEEELARLAGDGVQPADVRRRRSPLEHLRDRVRIEEVGHRSAAASPKATGPRAAGTDGRGHQLVGSLPSAGQARQPRRRPSGPEPLELRELVGGDERRHRPAMARDHDRFPGLSLPDAFGELRLGS